MLRRYICIDTAKQKAPMNSLDNIKNNKIYALVARGGIIITQFTNALNHMIYGRFFSCFRLYVYFLCMCVCVYVLL